MDEFVRKGVREDVSKAAIAITGKRRCMYCGVDKPVAGFVRKPGKPPMCKSCQDRRKNAKPR